MPQLPSAAIDETVVMAKLIKCWTKDRKVAGSLLDFRTGVKDILS